MEYPHPVIERFWQYREQMEQSFEKNRFDTFQQISVERFKLLRLPKGHPARKRLAELFREDTERWVERLEQQIFKKKAERAKWITVTGRGNRQSRSGRFVNQVG